MIQCQGSHYCDTVLCVVFAFRDLGAHIDGFSAVVAHTVVIGASKV